MGGGKHRRLGHLSCPSVCGYQKFSAAVLKSLNSEPTTVIIAGSAILLSNAVGISREINTKGLLIDYGDPIGSLKTGNCRSS